MKKIFKVLALLLLLVSCSKEIALPASNGAKMLVSNLNTESSINKVTSLMKDAGIEDKRIDRFREQVRFFNENIDNSLLLDKDFVKKDGPVEYDVYAMQDMMFEKYPDFPGINCRITSFGLIADKVDRTGEVNPDNEVTIIDKAAFTNPPVPTLTEEDLGPFDEFYSLIVLDKEGDREKDARKISDFLSDHGARLGNDKLSLISVYVYSDIDPYEKEAFVGHTGILLKLADNRLMLVEKLAFTAPYQAVIFESRDDLYTYLMDMYDTSSQDYPSKPLIFEDDKLMGI